MCLMHMDIDSDEVDPLYYVNKTDQEILKWKTFYSVVLNDVYTFMLEESGLSLDIF